MLVPINWLFFRFYVPQNQISAVISSAWLQITLQSCRVTSNNADSVDGNYNKHHSKSLVEIRFTVHCRQQEEVHADSIYNMYNYIFDRLLVFTPVITVSYFLI